MKVSGKNYRTVWFEGNKVKMINQVLLPHKFEIVSYKNHKEVAEAIKTMVVRGAPAIGATGAFGIALATLEANKSNFKKYIAEASQTLRSTRPTAQNLFHAIDYVLDSIKGLNNIEAIRKKAIKTANEFADADVESCKKIGQYGNTLIKDGFKIETHCNAGWLATVDWGTALSPIYVAHREGKKIFVYVDETRPRSQGMSLTAWELSQENVPHKIIPDNAGAYYMSKGIDMMIVGADRIAANGDVANKIGTFEKAIAAKYFNIPFYVAAPFTTIDFKCPDGAHIPIEQRSEDEVLYVQGLHENGKIMKVRVAPAKSGALNPAFDVTPANLITAIVTERGIIKPNKLKGYNK
jgi:S-methyl-5-thioribose-1-phosphate isomerase